MNKVPPKVYEVLRGAIKQDIENFTISVHDPNKKGDGYLGQIFFVTLREKDNDKQYNFVVKQAFCEKIIRDTHPIRDAFTNEIYFYTKLWPKFSKFQEIIEPVYRFNNLPKCLATTSEENFERLVLENLKCQGFVMHDKRQSLTKEMFELIFKIYGKFHAVSFAYKALKPEEFSDIVNDVSDVWITFLDKQIFLDAIRLAHKQGLESLKSGTDDEIIEKYKHYVDNGANFFRNSLQRGKYTALIHGDCWSNNMVFKFDDSGNLIDLRLIDFQIVRLGSPVADLAYCLYSGGTKKIFDDLDHLLQVYHDSLSQNLSAFGCDSDELYPLSTLKGEWKLYCQLGLSMGLMLWRGKLTYDDEVIDLTDISHDQNSATKFFEAKCDEETFKERARDIIVHAYENNFLF